MMRSAVVALAVVGALLALPVAGLGAATVTQSSTTTRVGPDSVDDVGCGLPTGVLTGTDTFAYQLVQLDNGSVNIQGTDTLVYRVDFPNGDYFLSRSATPFHFNTSAPGGTANSTSTTLDRGTVYDASGNAIGTVTFHDTAHATVAPGGNVTVNFDRFFITCT